jgi:hypothetical protein
MGVRVKLRVTLGGRAVEAVALANTGFETDEPQLLVPQALLARNGVSLEVLGRPLAVEYDTAGGSRSCAFTPKRVKWPLSSPTGFPARLRQTWSSR